MKPTVSSTMSESGAVVFSVEGRLPSPTTAENEKYPWSPWQVQYQEKALEKAAESLLLAQSNLEHVRSVVENRRKERDEARAVAKAAVLREQLAAVEAQGSVPVAAPSQGGTEPCSEEASTQVQPERSSAPAGRARSAGGRRRKG